MSSARKLAGIAAALAFSLGASQAQERFDDAAAPETAAAAEKAEDDAGAAPTITGFTDLRYANNSDRALWSGMSGGPTETPEPAGDTATFTMAETELDLRGKAGSVAYRVDIEAFGGAGNLDVGIEQAYLTYSFDFGGQEWQLTAGQFNAPIGWGTLDAPTMNTISHSSVFTALLPTNLVGVMVGTQFAESLDAKISLTNPWDASLDTVSNGMTVGFHLQHEVPNFLDGLTWGASFLFGREQAGTTENRLAADIWAQWDLVKGGTGFIEDLQLVYEYARGFQTVEAPVEQDHEWGGFRVELHADFGGVGFLDRLGATVRLDQIEIEATNTAVAGSTGHVLTGDLIDSGDLAGGTHGTVRGIALALDYALTDNLKLKAEYLSLFGESLTVEPPGTEFHQDLFSLQIVMTYPGK